MGMDTRPVTLLLLLTTCASVPALYFPQSDLSLRLPYLTGGGENLISGVRVILRARALRNDSSEPKSPKYLLLDSSVDSSVVDSSVDTHDKSATLDPVTGDLTLRVLPNSGETNAIIVEAKERGNGEAVLEIKVQPVPIAERKINCTHYVQDMCFWRTSNYRVYENRPITKLGSIGPEVYRSICPDFHITRYELLNGTRYFHIVNNSIFSNGSLDRDTLDPPGGPGPRVEVRVRCVVWEETTGVQHAPETNLGVDVLDEDDNPPVAQTEHKIEIRLRDFTVGDRLDARDLMVNDADELATNRYVVRLLGDDRNAMNITYSTLPIEHPRHSGKSPSTAIFTRIYARSTLLPISPYNVTLQVTDESLLAGYGKKSININLTFIGPQYHTTTSTTPLPSQQRIVFPGNVRIARVSSVYFRVAEPTSPPNPALIFDLNGTRALNVTRRGGIVYVADARLLGLSPPVIPITLTWRDPSGGNVTTTSFPVHVVDVARPKTSGCSHSCANAGTPQKCETSCGVASGTLNKNTFASECAWRTNLAGSKSSPTMTQYYETCSPTLKHCPDHRCDDLEQLDHRICPQDCTIESEVTFAEMNEGGRGIRSGVKLCTCDDMMQCNCGTAASRAGNGKVKKEPEKKEDDNANRVATSSPCGPMCLIGVIGASLFVLIVVVGTLVTWRYRMAAKGTHRECKHGADNGVAGLGILPSDYVDRGDGLLIGLDSLTTANRTLLLPKSCPPDPKWEFPRSRLTIEQVLGEGEFGRVLRARAIDIGGWPGPTTVAVKTLKEGACTTELADLLSEYQLLKEAQHPNVIRLLGACTSPGAPVYLIIEFAEFGSLRNYLRRSRHLESEGRAPCSTSLLSATPGLAREDPSSVTDAPCNYGVTPRDILSFAWQICKGMAYLADIKLVHRDLAARNVLLATGKVCKISDFGLTRDVYEDDAYLKRSKGRVPVKWMAPESLADHVYTSKSDVWSFGVLLWELVTLGASPYPGVDVHNLYNLLKAGYRMEKPANCSHQLYKLMVSCWHEEAGMRPSFKELTCHWERMLEDGVEYLDLNPRTVHNRAYFTTLHALDSPTNTGSDDVGYGNINILRTDAVNYLSKPSSEPVTKCDKINKLKAFWQEPIASFPEEPIKTVGYVNDLAQPSGLNGNHYESPIKLRNTSVTSNSDNTLKTPPNERPQSYIDMEGKKAKEQQDLLLFNNVEKKIENEVIDNGVAI